MDAVSPPPASATTPDQVAAGFATAWVRGGLTASQWWTGIKVWCEPVFAEDLRSVDPRNLPARSVTGPPVVDTPATVDDPGVYSVPTDAGVLRVTVAAVADQWLVSDNDFERRPG